MPKDYVPQNSQKFDTWFRNLTQYVSTKTTGTAPEWTHIPAQERDEFVGAYAQWYPDFSPTLNPDCTKGERNKRDEAKKRAEAVIRPFVQRHLYYKDVTDFDRIKMDLPLRDGTRTHHDAPEEMVEMSVKLRGIKELVVHFKVQGKSGKAKPAGYEGAVLIWAPLAKPPADTTLPRSPSSKSSTCGVLLAIVCRVSSLVSAGGFASGAQISTAPS